MPSDVGYSYSHLSTWDVGIATLKSIVLIRLQMECEKHFCFIEQLLYVLSLSRIARYRISYVKMQVRFLLLMFYYL